MQKKKKLVLSTWKSRYLVLRDGILKSYKSDKDDVPLDVWNSCQLQASEAPFSGQKICFWLSISRSEERRVGKEC